MGHDISPLCAFIFSTVSGDQYPQVREHALSLVPAHSECSSVRVDCWRSSSSFQMFLATGSSQEEGKIFWFILLSSLFFSSVGISFVVYTCFLHFFPP